VLLVCILPFWWRFWQCIYKYQTTKLWWPNLVNAGKYTTGIINILFVYLRSRPGSKFPKWLYIGWRIFTTLYAYSWDIRVDWGLFMRKKPDERNHYSYWLRDRLMYPAYFYYFAAVTNFLLRFAWLITIVDVKI
jgi:hypothetical protein